MPARCASLTARRAAVLLAGALFVTLATWDITVGRRALYWGDVMLYFLPSVDFLRRELLAGRVPLWNPYVLCGQPYIGNPQTSVLYPTTALLIPLSGVAFMSLNAVAHLAVAWVGTYRYARWLTVSRSAAVLCACTFAGSAAFLGRLQFPTMVQAMAWMPWLLLLSSKLLRRADAWRLIGLSCVVGLSIAAGHAQVTYMSLLFAAVAVLHACKSDHPSVVRTTALVVRAYGRWLLALIIGITMSAAYWLPVADVVRHSARPELPLLKADRFTLEWIHLAGLLWPGFLGNARSGDYWASGNMWEPAVYVGALPLVLAIVGAGACRVSGVARLHTLIAVVSLWLAAGVWGGLYLAAYYALPGMAVFHDPARFGIAAALSVAVLAAIGLDRVRGHIRISAPMIVVFSVAALLPWSARLTPTVAPAELRYRPRLLALQNAGRFYTPFRKDVWDRYVSYREYGPASGRYVHELTDTLLPNIGMRYGMSEAGGYEPVPIRWASYIEGLMREAVMTQSPALAQLAAITDTRYVLLPVGAWISHPCLSRVAGLPSVARVSGIAAGSVRFYSRARVISDTDRAIESLSRAAPDRDWAIVSSPVSLDEQSPDLETERMHQGVHICRTGVGRVDIALTGVTRACLAVVPITYMPGWKAQVNGRPIRPVRADAAFVGVPLAAGSRTLSLQYEPDTFRIGLFLTLTASCLMAFCAGQTASGRLRIRRRQVH